MRLHRFIGDFSYKNETEIRITDPKIVKQIKAVLRLRTSESIILSDGKGKEEEALIKEIGPKEIVCEVTRKLPKINIGRKINLYLAILKKENFELAVQKAVECGVAKIVPMITERTIKTGLNIPRLQKIIREASEQAGRNVVPILSPILDFKDALAEGSVSSEKIIFHPGGQEYRPDKNTKEISIFVGPEGGFTQNEIKLAENNNFVVASLGPLTLRGETAAIVSTYRAVYSA